VKAAFLVGPRLLVLRDVPDPTAPEDGLVLKVAVCGICGSDLRRWREGCASDHPIIPGHEFAGVVESVGKNVRGYRVGDRLAMAPDIHCGKCYYCRRGLYNLCEKLQLIGITPGYPGGMAEKFVITDEALANGVVSSVPVGLPLEESVLAEPCSSVLACHQTIGTNPSDVVVVMGGGPIGCLHIAVASSRGARIILSEPSPARRELAIPFSPSAIIDPIRENLVARVHELTDGLGADIAICANPVAATQTQAVELVRKRGRVVFFGGLSGNDPFTRLDANKIHYNEIQVIGSFSYHPVIHEQALQALARGQIQLRSLISRILALEQVSEAFELASSGNALKVLVKMS
jgi:L-iditol 2-dehydrogenase